MVVTASNDRLGGSHGNHGAIVAFWAREKLPLPTGKSERSKSGTCQVSEWTAKPARYSCNALKSIGLVKQVSQPASPMLFSSLKEPSPVTAAIGMCARCLCLRAQ